MRLRTLRRAGGLAALLWWAPGIALADSPEAAITHAQGEVAEVSREAGGVEAEVARTSTTGLSAEARLANAELLYRMKDYERASVLLEEILVAYPNTPSYPDALFMLGETYYSAHEYRSAGRRYREIVDHGTEPRYQPYVARALARLVDVALRINDLAGLDEVFAHLGEVPPMQVDAGLTYAKGKAYYFKKDYGDAQTAFASIPNGTPFTHQARYFEGLIAMNAVRPPPAAPGTPLPPATPPRSADYKAAIQAFHAVTDLPPDSDEHKHVIDLAWMAIGRLFYEMEQYDEASEAYGKVGRDSPEFDTMLYELAWVYVRVGDAQRAERALEVLSIADPTSSFIADGTLLRADLLLRAGAFDKALELYLAVRNQYEKPRAQVDAFLASTKDDLGVYYDKLSQQALDTLDTSEQLPPIAIRWAREAEDGPAAFSIIDDLNQCKTLIRESEHIVEKLDALANAKNRVRAFPDLLVGETKALGLLNRLSRARLALATALDDVEPGTLSGQIDTARSRRRALMGSVAQVPVTQADFDARDSTAMAQWNGVSQALTQRTVEVDALNATINGMRTTLKEDAQRGVTRDPATLAKINSDIDDNERDLRRYREQMVELRRAIETGRAQIGVGDSRYQADAQYRGDFQQALDEEVTYAAAGQAGERTQSYARELQPALGSIAGEERALTAMINALEQKVASRAQELIGTIDGEAARLQGLQVQLNALDGEARTLVGKVAQKNFGLVRDKLVKIILRADVGVTEQAWEVREEETSRVRNLQAERARESQVLDEELREVLDDDANPEQAPEPGH